MSELTIGELFAGYGGLGLGVQAALGGDLAWYSEIDKGALKILGHRFPDVPNIGDITNVNWANAPRVDILTGGFPCQDVSAAGKRAGLMHGTRSGLWHEFARAIEELRPGLVVIENVRGLLSARGDTSEEFERAEQKVQLVRNLTTWNDNRRDHTRNHGRTEDVHTFTRRANRLLGLHRRAVAERKRAERRIVRAIGTVLGTLADLGYDAVWHGLRAADIGAAHGRFRIFIIAYPTSKPGSFSHGDGLTAAVAALLGREWGRRTRDRRTGPANSHLLPTPRATDGEKGGPGQRGSSGDLMLPSAVAQLPAYADCLGPLQTRCSHRLCKETAPQTAADITLLPTPAVNDMGEGKTVDAWDAWTADMQDRHSNGNGHGKSLAIEAQRLLPTPSVADVQGGRKARSGDRNDEPLLNGIAAADLWGDYAPAIARWEQTLGRPAPAPTMTSTKGNPQLSPAFVEWLMGLPAGWITDVPGVTRNEALKALGNGVVPQQAEAAIRWILARMEVAA